MPSASWREVPAHWLVLAASLLFVAMGICVKFAAVHYTTGEIVMYRGVFGLVAMALAARAGGVKLATRMPFQHILRSVFGVSSLMCWFYAIGELPLATAMSLNYLSSVWVAVLLISSSLVFNTTRVDMRLVWVVLVGFAGVVLMLQPSMNSERWLAGVVGLLSGLATAVSYLQIGALGRAGEPSCRIVFYFSLGSLCIGAVSVCFTGFTSHTGLHLVPLLGVGLCATVAQQLMTLAYSRGNAIVNASVQYSGVAFSVAFGVLLLNEDFSGRAMVGMGIIGFAVLCSSLLKKQPARLPASGPTKAS